VAKLQFLANMNISPLTVGQLRTRGWDITRVSEIMEKELEEGVVITVDETSARYRNLPIRLE